MSKNLDETKLRRMAEKYRKFKAKHAQQGQEDRKSLILRRFVEKCEHIWGKIVPPCVRDYMGEFELFNHYWQAEMGKSCSNPLISHLSLQQNLRSYKPGLPVVLGVIYNPQSLKKIANFINHLRVDELKSEVILCMINNEGKTYRNTIEPKIVLFEETVAVFWRGLFNQMILLSKLRIQDADLFKTVKTEVAARTEYENRIIDAAEGMKLGESYSQVLM